MSPSEALQYRLASLATCHAQLAQRDCANAAGVFFAGLSSLNDMSCDGLGQRIITVLEFEMDESQLKRLAHALAVIGLKR